MSKYIKLLKYEFKNIIRDKMTMILMIYPILIIFLCAYVLPAILQEFNGANQSGTTTAVIVIIIIFTAITPFIASALLGFILLDNRDDNTLDTIRVTPISLKGYIIFKSTYAYLLSVIASFTVIMGIKWLSGDAYTIMGVNLLDGFNVNMAITYALVAGLFTPAFALFMAALARNKIEGFAYLKSAGMIMCIPALAVLEVMQDARQYILGIIPIFWPVKGLMISANLISNPSDLPIVLYMIIGSIYMIILSIVAYKVFEKKIQN